MSRANGTGPPDAPAPPPRGDGFGNFGREVVERLTCRSAAFQRATQRKGLPMTWGVGKALRPDLEPKRAKKTQTKGRGRG